jgi:hypothetical protein
VPAKLAHFPQKQPHFVICQPADRTRALIVTLDDVSPVVFVQNGDLLYEILQCQALIKHTVLAFVNFFKADVTEFFIC